MKKSTVIGKWVIVAALFAPLTAYAYTDIPWLVADKAQSVKIWLQNKLEILTSISSAKVEVMTQMAKEHAEKMFQAQSQADQMQAVITKQTMADKELVQAKMLADAQRAAAKAAAEARDKFENPIEINAMCEAGAGSQAAAKAVEDTNLNAKTYSTVLNNRSAKVTSNAAEVKRVVDEHKEYCSVEDGNRDRQCKPAKEEWKRNADINASTFLDPVNGSTYTPEEDKAAKAYINKVVGTAGVEQLPGSVENTPAGKMYYGESLKAQAQFSIAQSVFAHIHSTKVANASLSAATGSPADKLSLMGVMKKLFFERFSEPKWNEDLMGMNTNGLLKEIAYQLAGKNFMDYQMYLQNQRIEAVLATQLAISATEHNNEKLNALRKMAVSQ